MTAQPTADPVIETIGYFGVLLRMDDGIRAAHHTLIVNDELRAVSGQVRTEADRLGTALMAYGMHGTGLFVARMMPAAMAANWFHPTRIVLGPGGLP